MVAFQELHRQLMLEREARQQATEQLRHLQRDVEELKHEAKRRDNELEVARLALSVYDEETDVQDLVEHNIALREQVQSLKAAFAHVQSYSDPPAPCRRLEHRDGSNRDIEVELQSSLDSPLEDVITRNEVQQLLAKLAAKESQLQLLHQRCASWEQQVIELKFELQSMRHTAKEQEEVTRIAQHSIVRQECCSVCKALNASSLMKNLQMEKKAIMATISPRAPRTDLEHYKSLSHLRGVFWLKEMERAESLSKTLTDERRENSDLRAKIITMERDHQSRIDEVETLRSRLDNALSCCQVLEDELSIVTAKAEGFESQVKLLQQDLDSEKCLRKTDKTRSARIILDLRGELNHQLMELEQLHNASVLFSPKNSRGIDTKRRSIRQANPAA